MNGRDDDTVILVPVLTRVHRVVPLLASIRNTCSARVLFLSTQEDTDMRRAIDQAGAEQLVVPWQPVGDYARKINAGFRYTDEPLIFTGADDLEFRPGWLDAARAKLTDGIGVVGTNDLGSPRVMAGEHATHFLITRAYVTGFGTIDQPGQVMHEGYVHEYVDDEVVGTARCRNAWAPANESHVEHLHPDWGKAETDPLYQQQRQRMRLSRPLYQRRRLMWT